ncbi:MAG: hypothetical protein P4L65_06505 [Legionella sp.]|nr:hypothetical protein [Legionella sp.]
MNDFNKNAKEIKNKASTLYEAAKENAASAYYDTKPKAEELFSKVGDTASDLYESGKVKVGEAEGYVEDSITAMSRSVQRQPMTSVLLAAGIGYLLAKLLK